MRRWLLPLAAAVCLVGTILWCVDGGWEAVGAAACWGGFLSFMRDWAES